MRFTPPDGVLNLAQTLDCGQSFRFYPVTLENNIPAWRGVAFSRGLTVYQDENNDLVLDCTEQEFHDIWFDYFDFNTDYKKSREVLSALHPALKEAAEFAYRYLAERDVHCLLYQGRYNMFNREPEEEGILQQARENGTGFIAFSPLAQGLLTNRYLNEIGRAHV